MSEFNPGFMNIPEHILKTQYYPLHKLQASFIAVNLPANCAFYYSYPEAEFDSRPFSFMDNWRINSSAFLVKTWRCQTIKQVEDHLSRPGLHHVMCVTIVPNNSHRYWLRSHTYEPGTPECDYAVVKPRPGGLRPKTGYDVIWDWGEGEWFQVPRFKPEEDYSSIPKYIKPLVPTRNVVHLDLEKFPHTCPKCQRPAYVGFVSIECSNRDCK